MAFSELLMRLWPPQAQHGNVRIL